MNLRQLTLALSLALCVPTLAWASECPSLMAVIDAALADNPEVDAETLAEVKALRAEGEKLHDSGDHNGSVEALNEALALLDTE